MKVGRLHPIGMFMLPGPDLQPEFGIVWELGHASVPALRAKCDLQRNFSLIGGAGMPQVAFEPSAPSCSKIWPSRWVDEAPNFARL